MSDKIEHLTADTFKTAIATGTVLVDFWAPWCPPCKAIAPVLDEVATELTGKLKVAKLDIEPDENKPLAVEYGVRSIPTFIIFKNGVEAEKIVGVSTVATKPAFIAKLQPHL
ncbi:MAG: thioredoxin [Opitutaceae bacterium]|jgi:thioredoxin 1|nr:thioredoxin [Opitutaceae bacterium]